MNAGPPRVWPAVMVHRWSWISFLHWRYEPARVEALLPRGLEVETFDGSAWVGITPFLLSLRTPGLPYPRAMTDVPEMNVRTYVRGPEGLSGIWFFSLDLGRLPAVIGARATYGLPYYWAEFKVQAGERLCRYRARRVWPPPAAATEATVEVGESVGGGAEGELADFLTARWRLFTLMGGSLWQATVAHPRWPLRTARAAAWETTHLSAAGLPSPLESPLAHWSSGVEVRVGPPLPAG